MVRMPHQKYNYTCKCEMLGECGDKTVTFDTSYSAGFSSSAECVGQTTVLPDFTQLGVAPGATFSPFDFDSNSTVQVKE